MEFAAVAQHRRDLEEDLVVRGRLHVEVADHVALLVLRNTTQRVRASPATAIYDNKSSDCLSSLGRRGRSGFNKQPSVKAGYLENKPSTNKNNNRQIGNYSRASENAAIFSRPTATRRHLRRRRRDGTYVELVEFLEVVQRLDGGRQLLADEVADGAHRPLPAVLLFDERAVPEHLQRRVLRHVVLVRDPRCNRRRQGAPRQSGANAAGACRPRRLRLQPDIHVLRIVHLDEINLYVKLSNSMKN